MKKKLAVISMAAVMVLGATLNSFAADNTVAQNKGEADTKWEVQLSDNPAIISVAVPAVVPFEIGLTKDPDAGKFDKVVVPAVTAKNSSTVGVDLYLTTVLDDPGEKKLLPNVKLSLNGKLLEAKDYTSDAAENGVKLGSMSAKNGTMKLNMTGAKADADPILGADGDAYTITTTFKVVKSTT